MNRVRCGLLVLAMLAVSMVIPVFGEGDKAQAEITPTTTTTSVEPIDTTNYGRTTFIWGTFDRNGRFAQRHEYTTTKASDTLAGAAAAIQSSGFAAMEVEDDPGFDSLCDGRWEEPKYVWHCTVYGRVRWDTGFPFYNDVLDMRLKRTYTYVPLFHVITGVTSAWTYFDNDLLWKWDGSSALDVNTYYRWCCNSAKSAHWTVLDRDAHTCMTGVLCRYVNSRIQIKMHSDHSVWLEEQKTG